jgi:hypothetical protein
MRLAQLGVTEESQEIGSRREACGPMVLKLTNFLNHEILKKNWKKLGKINMLITRQQSRSVREFYRGRRWKKVSKSI